MAEQRPGPSVEAQAQRGQEVAQRLLIGLEKFAVAVLLADLQVCSQGVIARAAYAAKQLASSMPGWAATFSTTSLGTSLGLGRNAPEEAHGCPARPRSRGDGCWGVVC